MLKEARLPVMWAIDFRDMHSGIHGLYYAKDRKLVEDFYEALKSVLDERNPEYADDPDLREMHYQDLWDEFYPRIQMIDEINFRDIGKLPSGKYGIIVDDVEYRLVNVMNCLDIYEESKKVVKEAGNYPMWWIRFCDSRNKLGQAAEDMQEAYFESGNNKWNEYYHKMSSLWGQLSGVQYKESTKRCNKMKHNMKKITKESTADNDGVPRIYVGTYAKYNDGSIDGKWIDIPEYNTYEEFVDACRELHKDEKDPEFMVQDFENFPMKWYHEGGLPTEEEFDKINEYYMMDDSLKDAYAAYVNYTDNDSIEDFQEAYEGQFDSAEDFAYHIVDSFGWENISQETLDMYFDYDSFGRDLMYDFHRGDEDETDADGNPEDPDHYYDNEGQDMGEYESDRQVAYDFVDDMGGVDQLGQETAQRYFDYDSFGRDLLINDYFEEDGYVFSRR